MSRWDKLIARILSLDKDMRFDELCKVLENLPYRLEIVPDTAEAGFVAFYPELPGCITCGEDIYKAVANAVDAKKLWLLTAVEDGLEIKEPAAFDYADFMTKFTRSVPKRERVFA